jgi:chromosomal replication initiation ATPase DnaA
MDSTEAPRQSRLPFDRPDDRLPFVTGPSNSPVIDFLALWSDRKDAAARDPSPVIALIGPAGSGKTRLVEELSAAPGAPRFLDDAHLLGNEPLFRAINEAIATGTRLVLVGKGSPLSWIAPGAAAPDLESRLRGVPVVRLDAPTEQMLAEALKGGFAAVGLTIPATLLPGVARRMARRFPAVEAIVRSAYRRSAEIGSGRALLRAAVDDNPDQMLD